MCTADGEENVGHDEVPEKRQRCIHHPPHKEHLAHQNLNLHLAAGLVIKDGRRFIAVHRDDHNPQQQCQPRGADLEKRLGVHTHTLRKVLAAEQPPRQVVSIHAHACPAKADDDLHRTNQNSGLGELAVDVIDGVPGPGNGEGQGSCHGEHVKDGGTDGSV